jgi:signal transduction histidine kinase/CheY-like chemotaxis protein
MLANEEDENHINTFKRAANLLYSSLSLDEGGGVVFLDDFRINSGFSASDSPRPHTLRRESTLNSPGDKFGCEVLASVSSDEAASFSGSRKTAIFLPPSPSDLTALIKRYPRGKLFTLDTDSTYASTSSGEDRIFSPETRRSSRRKLQSKADATLLSGHFPTARQVIFVPIWDAISGRWSACFVYNCCEFRTINHATEFLYCIAFCNCVATEISRLASMNADQQKQNFIGSISHELRSPLHGILGSMEFLSETDCSSFQHSLIDTANSCAVTLLDTIQQILDFSKVNAFERNANRVTRHRKSGQESGRSSLLHPHMNIYGIVDLAAVTEEVVEGVATGQEFRDITKLDSAELDSMYSRRRLATHAAVLQEGVKAGPAEGGSGTGRNSNVEIILDIRPRASWLFVTQPGAFRRIVMNLFGNALKYTQKGYIKVKLDAEDFPEDLEKSTERIESGSMITLVVEDSGQGISPQFLRSKLFTPFAQENSLNPGTGLGLSLVKQIVGILNGEIKVNSALGVGTEVIVQVPMTDDSRPFSAANSSSTPSSANSIIDRSRDESLQIVQQVAKGKTVALYGKARPQQERTPRDSWASQRACLWRYFSDWYRFSSVTEWTDSVEADVIVVEEQELQALLDILSGSANTKPPIVIVVCPNASLHASMKIHSGAGPMEFISVPLGPYKLARSLKIGFEKMAKLLGTDQQELSPGQAERKASESAETVSRVTLNSTDANAPDIQVMQQGTILGAEDSNNAQMAMGTRSLSSEESSTIGPLPDAFPFPSQVLAEQTKETNPQEQQTQSRPVRPSLEKRRTISATRPELLYQPISPSPMSSIGTRTNAQGGFVDAETQPPAPTRSPRLLLVDDNNVNLRLLQTFMKKRAYTAVHCAEDGQQAVSIFRTLISQTPPEPPDIILMDISMPVLDGFAATRQIRKIEADVANTLPPMQTPAPSLIIALTGLASSRDQSEAFVSGFDLYMTKPVSFKEVGRLLDNWQANGGAAQLGVPHGPVTEHTEVTS